MFIKEIRHADYKIVPNRMLNAITIDENSFASKHLKVCNSEQDLRTQTPSIFLREKLFVNKPALKHILDHFPKTSEELMITITTEQGATGPPSVLSIKAIVAKDGTNFWVTTNGPYIGTITQLSAEGATLGKPFLEKVLYTFSPAAATSCICFDPPFSQAAKMHMARPFSLVTTSLFYVLHRAASTLPDPESVSPLEHLLSSNCRFSNLLTEAGAAYPITNILRLVQSLPTLYFLHPAAEIHIQNLSLYCKKQLFLTPHTCGQLHRKLTTYKIPEELITDILTRCMVPLTTLITNNIFGVSSIGFSGLHYIIRNSDLYYAILRSFLDSPSSYNVYP